MENIFAIIFSHDNCEILAQSSAINIIGIILRPHTINWLQLIHAQQLMQLLLTYNQFHYCAKSSQKSMQNLNL